ncbi:MAG TPA: hypothetical protein VE684_10105 [Crenalkalicoccus sp.]|nr:hypothetical protein [Crenalkalicoccus sp.]
MATDGFLGQLDRAIGLSNALARALSGAARALDGVRRGAGLLTDSERLADLREQAEAIARQIATLDAGIDTTRNNGTLRPRLTDEDRQRRLAELREQYRKIQEEIARAEREAGERQRQEQERAGQQAADARRTRAAQDIEELRKQLDNRFKIQQEYEDRLRRLREAEAAGALTAADRTRLETLALRERDEALRRLQPRVESNRQA